MRLLGMAPGGRMNTSMGPGWFFSLEEDREAELREYARGLFRKPTEERKKKRRKKAGSFFSSFIMFLLMAFFTVLCGWGAYKHLYVVIPGNAERIDILVRAAGVRESYSASAKHYGPTYHLRVHDAEHFFNFDYEVINLFTRKEVVRSALGAGDRVELLVLKKDMARSAREAERLKEKMRGMGPIGRYGERNIYNAHNRYAYVDVYEIQKGGKLVLSWFPAWAWYPLIGILLAWLSYAFFGMALDEMKKFIR